MKSNCYLKVISKSAEIPTKTRSVFLRCGRDKVHENGWWHYGILTNIIRINPLGGELEILLQKRSNRVDIAKGKLDQSLATQMLYLDKDIKYAFLRGIKEELNLNTTDIKFAQFLPKSNFYIVKEYVTESMVLNREKIFIFVVILRNNIEISTTCNKIKTIRWISWKNFVNLIERYPHKFTKTVRFFVKNEKLKSKLERFMIDFVNDKTNSKLNLKKLNILYISPKNGVDIIQNIK